MGAAPGLLECAVEVAASHGFELVRQTDSGVRFVHERAPIGSFSSGQPEIVDVEITDTVNTPVAEIRVTSESASDPTSETPSGVASGPARRLAEEIRARCGGPS